MSGIILKMYSIENILHLRYIHTIRIKLGCLLNATEPRETEAPATGPHQKWILGQMNQGFNPTLPFLRALPQYKHPSKTSVFLKNRWKLYFALVCCRWAANMHGQSTADYPSLETGQ